MIYFWAALCFFACGLTLWSQYKQQATMAGIFKTFASLCFFLPALYFVLNNNSVSFALYLTIGFGLSLTGDVLLIKTTDKRLFLMGLLAFLLAHIAYAWAFIDAGINRYEFILTMVVVTGAMIGCYVWLFKYLKGFMKTAVAAYLAAIGLMLITAMLTKHPQQQLIIGGALLFALSDLFVARQRFVSPGFKNRLIGLPLYYAGQLLLLAALLY